MDKTYIRVKPCGAGPRLRATSLYHSSGDPVAEWDSKTAKPQDPHRHLEFLCPPACILNSATVTRQWHRLMFLQVPGADLHTLQVFRGALIKFTPPPHPSSEAPEKWDFRNGRWRGLPWQSSGEDFAFTARGSGSIPGQGTKIPHATWHSPHLPQK